VSRKVVSFKMPLNGEHDVPLQTSYSIERIGLSSPLTRAAGGAPSLPSRRPGNASVAVTPLSRQVGGTDLVDSLSVEVGQARPSVPSTSFRRSEARPDEPTCDALPPLEHERQPSSPSEIDHWVQYGRVTERPPAGFMMPSDGGQGATITPIRDRIAESASDAPAMSAVTADSAVRRCATKMEDMGPGGSAPAVTIDIEQLSNNFVRLVDQGCKAIAACLKLPEDGRLDEDTAGEIIGVARTFGHVAEYWLTHPHRAIEVQTNLGKAYLDLWLSATKRMLGAPPEPVAGSESEDRRFADPQWLSNPFLDVVKRAYLLTSQWASRLVKEADGVDAHTRRKAEFYVRQFTDALSPANFVLTNPDLLRETLCSNAGNLVAGMRMLAEPRDHSGQGDLSERAHAAHSIRADHLYGAETTDPHRSALDQ
jgi:hypothetical protein